MLIFLFIIFIVFATIFLSLYFLRKYYIAPKIEDITVQAFSQKLHRVINITLYQYLRVIAAISFLFLIIFLSIPVFGWKVALGFLIGVISFCVAIYIVFILLSRLNATLIDRSSKGVIECFQTALGGVGVLSTLTLTLSLLVIVVYYVVFSPAAIELAGFAFGITLVSVFFRISSIFYKDIACIDKKFFKKIFHESSIKDTRSSSIVAIAAANKLANGLMVFIEIFTISSLSIITVMLAASFALPAFGGAIVLPMLIVAICSVVSLISLRLIRVTVTTNIVKNIILVFLGSVVLALILVSPFIIFVLSGNAQYSSLAIWASTFFGFFTSGVIAAIIYLNKVKSIENNSKTAFLIAVIAGLILINNWLAGLYGIAIFIVSMAALSGIFLMLNLFTYISINAYESANIIELSKERKSTLSKLPQSLNLARDGLKIYTLIITVLTYLVWFILYKQELTARLISLEFSLDNIYIVTGIMLGGSLMYLLYSRTTVARTNLKFTLQKLAKYYLNIYSKNTEDTSKISKFRFSDFLTLAIFRISTAPLILVFFAPVFLALVLKEEGLAGVLIGEITISLFWGTANILKQKKKDTLEQRTQIQQDDSYALITVLTTSLMSTSIISLLAVALFL